MATLKRRIPVTLPSDLENIIEQISKRNNLSLSQTITLFLRHGLEMAEDEYFGTLADELHEKNTGFVSHEEFWGDVLSR